MDKIIGQRIKENRIKRGISQEYFAKHVLKLKGTDTANQQLISKIETGRRRVTAAELYNIAKFLNKPIQYFFGEDRDGKEIDQHCEIACDEKIKDLCLKVKKVVDSGKHWGTSLEANIHSFAAGLEQDKDIHELKKSIADLSSLENKNHITKKRAM